MLRAAVSSVAIAGLRPARTKGCRRLQCTNSHSNPQNRSSQAHSAGDSGQSPRKNPITSLEEWKLKLRRTLGWPLALHEQSNEHHIPSFYTPSHPLVASTSTAPAACPGKVQGITLVTKSEGQADIARILQVKRRRRLLRALNKKLAHVTAHTSTWTAQYQAILPYLAKLRGIYQTTLHDTDFTVSATERKCIQDFAHWSIPILRQKTHDEEDDRALISLSRDTMLVTTTEGPCQNFPVNLARCLATLVDCQTSCQSECTSMSRHRNSLPSEVVSEYAKLEHYPAAQAELYDLIAEPRLDLSLQDICDCLARTSPEAWLQLTRRIIQHLTRAILERPDDSIRFYHALLEARKHTEQPRAFKGRLRFLHKFYRIRQFWDLHHVNRRFGPRPEQMALFHALKYLLSANVEHLQHVQRTADVEVLKSEVIRLQRKNVSSLIDMCRRSFIPPDRQIIAALLSFALSHGDVDVACLDSMYTWLWHEWNILREDEPRPLEDDVLLISFVDAIDPSSSHWKAMSGNVASQEKTQDIARWSDQALTLAVDLAGIQTSPGPGLLQHSHAQDPPASLPFGLLRSIALAALRVGDLRTCFVCLWDTRLHWRHVLAILHGIVHLIKKLSPSRLETSRALAKFCAAHCAPLAGRLNTHLGPDHASQLAEVAILFLERGYHELGARFALVLSNPRHYGSELLRKLLLALYKVRATKAMHTMYERVAAPEWPDPMLAIFLSSPSPTLSDKVWMDASNRAMTLPLLRARLHHHKYSARLRYQHCIKDYKDAMCRITTDPDEKTMSLLLDLHIRAGRRKQARNMFGRLSGGKHPSSTLTQQYLRLVALSSLRMGPKSHLGKLAKCLDTLERNGGEYHADLRTDVHILLQTLPWAEFDEHAVWRIFKMGTELAARGGKWRSEIKPLYKDIIATFRKRGNHEAARKVVDFMITSGHYVQTPIETKVTN